MRGGPHVRIRKVNQSRQNEIERKGEHPWELVYSPINRPHWSLWQAINRNGGLRAFFDAAELTLVVNLDGDNAPELNSRSAPHPATA